MAIQTFIRGASIGFTATFVDTAGNPLVPSGANLTLNYLASGVWTQAILAMTMTGGTAFAAWDSSVADATSVEWFILPTGGVKAPSEGSFFLLKNKSNPGS